MADRILETKKIIVYQAQLGEWDNLNHLIVCKKTKSAVIVDPLDADYWVKMCEENGWNLSHVWLTHTHWDHCRGVYELQNKGIWVHRLERNRGWDGPSTDEWSNEPHSFVMHNFGDLQFEAHCTPGHTPGHVVFVGEGIVVSGDCIFCGRCGRTDLFGGNADDQRESLRYLRARLRDLPTGWLVLPGHQYELKNGTNPTYVTVGELLKGNEAINAVDDDLAWASLDFLSFDDDLARKARQQRAEVE